MAEMAWLERRPELGALCKAAREGQGRVDVELVQRILKGVSGAGARNVVSWCHMLGLVDARGALTRIGEGCAEGGEAPVPEQGIFELWFVEHPLLGRRILHAAPLRIDVDVRFEDLKSLPSSPEVNTTFRSVVGPERFVLRKLLGTTGLMPSSDRSTCQLRWSIDLLGEREQFRLEGQLDLGDAGTRDIQHEAERAGINVASLREEWAWQHLGRHGKWQPTERRLDVRFDNLPEAAQESFKQSYELGAVSIPGKGQYEGVRIEDVRIGPLTGHDAQHWATARLDRALAKSSTYLTRRDLRHRFAELVENTPLEAFRPKLLGHEEFVRRSTGPAALFRLAAPVDLAPVPVDADDLGPFVVAEPAADTPLSPDVDVVRVPHLSRLPMLALVGKLLSQKSPRRVLLCDRYVWKDNHLAALRLLKDSIREYEPSARLEIVTLLESREKGVSEEIRKITGKPPEHYDRVFGRRDEHPHARYLVIDAGKDGIFGWQMDNSPLDARTLPGTTPDLRTPLVFRDFGAVRLERDDLPGKLGAWLEGGAR
ncbi:MAG TPA: hypothetical protein VM694_40470 [Polyangium sp.]|nr:hypothetical protein [Polyangium sp.]